MSKRRSCISSRDSREDKPGSPERPRTLGPPGSPIGSLGRAGNGAALNGSRAVWARRARRKLSRAEPFAGVADSVVREAAAVEGPFAASPLRRLRPPRRPRRRRFLSGESSDSAPESRRRQPFLFRTKSEACPERKTRRKLLPFEVASSESTNGRRQHKIARGMSGIRGGNFGAKPDRGFLRLGLPIRAAKTFRGGEIPFGGIGILASRFEVASQFERNHGVACFLVQIRKLSDGVLAGAGPTNPGGDLFPVSHVLGCIVAVEWRYSQRRRQVRGKRLFAHRDDICIDGGKGCEYSSDSPLWRLQWRGRAKLLLQS